MTTAPATAAYPHGAACVNLAACGRTFEPAARLEHGIGRAQGPDACPDCGARLEPMPERPARYAKPPTPAAFNRWWDSTRAITRPLECFTCGKTGPVAYIQPQHPFWSLRIPGAELDAEDLVFAPRRADGARILVASCADCIAQANRRRKQIRKAQLAEAPRCEACGRHRGTMKVGMDRVLLCGRCTTRAKAEHQARLAGAGGLALFLPGPPSTRAYVLELARS